MSPPTPLAEVVSHVTRFFNSLLDDDDDDVGDAELDAEVPLLLLLLDL